jgi:hypothetical protein
MGTRQQIIRNKMTRRDLYTRNPIPFPVKGIIYILALILFVSCGKRGTDEFTVMTGPFRQSVTQAGELQAISASFISMPPIGYHRVAGTRKSSSQR